MTFFEKVKRLFGKKVFFLFITTIFLGFFLGLIEMIFGFALQNFLVSFDLIQSKNIPSILLPFATMPTVFLASVAVVRFCFYFLASFLPDFSYETFSSRVRRMLGLAILGTDAENSYLSVAEVSHITTNLTPKVGNFVSSFCQMISAFFLMLTILVGMAVISANLTLVALVAVAVMIFPTIILKSAYQSYAGSFHKNLKMFSLNILRDLRNIYFLRIVGTNNRELSNLNTVNNTIYKQFIKYAVGISVNNTWPLFAGVLIVIFTIWGNHRENYVESGTLITFIYLLIRLPQAISQLARSFGHVQFCYPFLTNFLEYSEMFSDKTENEAREDLKSYRGVPESLSVKDLSIGRNAELLKDVNLEINKGDFLLVKGESGKGKTTFLMTILGIVEKLSGDIKWNNVDLSLWSREVFRSNVGYSGTDPFLIDSTVRENLFYGVRNKDLASNDLEKVLNISCCTFIHELDGGLSYKLGESGEGISAGQKQRISLARALLYNPSVLILDEATANIDEITEEKIFVEIRKNYPELTIIAVSHRESVRKFANKYLQL